MENVNHNRTLTQDDIAAIVDALNSGGFADQLITKFAKIVGVKVQEEDLVDSDTARKLLGNISRGTLKRYANLCPEIRPGGKFSRGYSRRRLHEFKTRRQLGEFRKNKVYPVC